jgi:hypothetical protein
MGRLRPRTREGRCYELAWKYLIQDERFANWILVHGQGRGPDGQRIGHAWLEFEGQSYDATLDQFFDTTVYQMKFATGIGRKFTAREAAIIASQAGHFGPWD